MCLCLSSGWIFLGSQEVTPGSVHGVLGSLFGSGGGSEYTKDFLHSIRSRSNSSHIPAQLTADPSSMLNNYPTNVGI